MKLKILFVSVLLASSFASYAMDKNDFINIPEETVLKTRLGMIGMSHFMEKTSCARQLAGKRLLSGVVNTTVELCIDDYFKLISQDYPAHSAEQVLNTAITVQINKSSILEAFGVKSNK